MTAPRPLVLVIEDEPDIRAFLRSSLQAEGYRIAEAETGARGATDAATHKPDLVVVDLGLPDIDGIEVIRRIRGWSPLPILVLSARAQERAKVEALDAGADDYVTKPFGIEELLARIRAALRRSPLAQEGGPRGFSAPDLEIDFETRRVHANGKDVRLTPKEFELLRHLVANAGKPVTHRELLQSVWGPDYGDEPEYLRVFVNQLRKKIEANPAKPKYILTEPWVGYRFAGE